MSCNATTGVIVMFSEQRLITADNLDLWFEALDLHLLELKAEADEEIKQNEERPSGDKRDWDQGRYKTWEQYKASVERLGVTRGIDWHKFVEAFKELATDYYDYAEPHFNLFLKHAYGDLVPQFEEFRIFSGTKYGESDVPPDHELCLIFEVTEVFAKSLTDQGTTLQSLVDGELKENCWAYYVD